MPSTSCAHTPARTPSRARYALLLLPALLGGCYVVPIVPRPVYGPVYGPGYHQPRPGHHHHHRQHRHWRGEAPEAAAVAVAPPSVHIEVARSSR